MKINLFLLLKPLKLFTSDAPVTRRRFTKVPCVQLLTTGNCAYVRMNLCIFLPKSLRNISLNFFSFLCVEFKFLLREVSVGSAMRWISVQYESRNHAVFYPSMMAVERAHFVVSFTVNNLFSMCFSTLNTYHNSLTGMIFRCPVCIASHKGGVSKKVMPLHPRTTY